MSDADATPSPADPSPDRPATSPAASPDDGAPQEVADPGGERPAASRAEPAAVVPPGAAPVPQPTPPYGVQQPGPPPPPPGQPRPPHPDQPYPGQPYAGQPYPPYPGQPRPGQYPTPYAAPVVPRPPTALSRARAAFWAEGRQPAPGSVLAVAAAVGVLGGALLVVDVPGLGVALVGVAVWAAAVPTLVRRRAWNALLTAALAAALVAVFAVRAAPWVLVVCSLVAAFTATVAATSASSAPAVLTSPLTWAAGVLRALPWVRHGAGALVGPRRGSLLAVLRSVAVTVVLLVVFGALFASADSVFASYIPRVEVGSLPGRVVVGLLVALATATLAHLAAAPPGWSDHRTAPGRPATRTEWLLPVGSLALLVLAFVLVQVGALVDGHRHVLETLGLTYAQYARQGFAQLVAATALTLVVVGVAARRAPVGTATDRLVARVTLGVLCVGTLGVVASALRRMDLYVEAFGLTRVRLLVLVAEVALGVVLLLVMAAGVRWRGGWLPVAVVQVVAVTTLGFALADPDAQIARHNTTETARAELDLAYLRGLSADAVPVLDELDGPLRECALAGRWVVEPRGLADANLARARAARVLDERAVPVSVLTSGDCDPWDTFDR